MAPMVAVALDEDPPQPVSNGPGAEDLQVVVGWQPFGDPGDEPLQVLQAARLAGVLRAAAAAVTDARVVTHVARAPTMGRHVGQGMLDHDPVIAPADDHGSSRASIQTSAHGRVAGSSIVASSPDGVIMTAPTPAPSRRARKVGIDDVAGMLPAGPVHPHAVSGGFRR